MIETLQELWAQLDWWVVGVWSLTLTLLLVGLLGTVLPLLPGPLLLFIAAGLHTLLRPESGMSFIGLVILAVLLALAVAVDIASGAAGAKWFGASKQGVYGVLIGGLCGLPLGLPGLIVGPIAGGLIGEMVFAKRDWKEGMKSTWGSVLGTGLGMVARLALSVGMIGVFFIDALLW
jgi:uncharacterized protein